VEIFCIERIAPLKVGNLQDSASGLCFLTRL
jgi:hypothetical protein